MAPSAERVPVTVTFVDVNREIRAMSGDNLRTLALNAGIPLYSVHLWDPIFPKLAPALPSGVFNCRGLGLCGTCIVEVVEGAENLQPVQPNGKEKFNLGPTGNWKTKHWHLDSDHSKYRLACQVKVMGDVKLKTVRDTVDFEFE